MFDLLDPDSEPGRVYRAMTRLGRSTVDAIAQDTGLSGPAVTRTLTELSDAVIRLGDEWEARPPASVLSEVLRDEEVRRTALWRAGAELDELYHVARRDAGHRHDVESVDAQTMFVLTEQLQERAAKRIRWLDRPPYRSTPEHFAAQESLQGKRMAAGLVYRTLYHQAVYEDTDLFASMTRMTALGEDARVLADLPVKLIIGDDHTAVLVPEPERLGVDGALLLHASGLLNAFAGVFETLWTLGVPVTTSGAHLSDRDRTIITLMAAGVTDDAIARRLHLSRRTVVRRITAMLDRLGATTRFQAGVQAANRGWL